MSRRQAVENELARARMHEAEQLNAEQQDMRGESTTVAMTEAECLQFGVPFGSTWKKHEANAAAPLFSQMAGAGGQVPPDSGRKPEAMRNMGVTQFIQEGDRSIGRTKNASESSGMATSDVVHVLVSRLEQEAERAGSLTSRLKHLIVKKLCISRLHWCMRIWTLGAAHSRNLSGTPTLLALPVPKKYKY